MKRPAFTLLEVIIVLSIMVSLMAISWPKMRNAAERATLREAALQVKAGLAEARDLAVRSGAQIQFSFQHNGSEFRIATAESAVVDQENVIDLEAPQNVPALDEDTSDAYDEMGSTSHELPDPVRFASGDDAEAEERADLLCDNAPPGASLLEGLAPLSSDDSVVGDMEEQSIHFFPDGRGSSAIIRLGSADTQDSVTLTVRALTGGVTIGKIEHEKVAEDQEPSPDEELDMEELVIEDVDEIALPPIVDEEQ